MENPEPRSLGLMTILWTSLKVYGGAPLRFLAVSLAISAPVIYLCGLVARQVTGQSLRYAQWSDVSNPWWLLEVLVVGLGLLIGASVFRTGLYFLLLGLGYMSLEIAAIQRFLLLLPSPVHSLSVVLCTFLVGSGVGSLFLGRLSADPRRTLRVAALGIVLLALAHAAVLPALLPALLGRPLPLRVMATVLLLAPLAFLMGIPFPAGFALVRRRSEALAPWAWGVNGCASVAGASVATLFAIEVGLAGLTVAGGGLYLVALLLAPRPATDSARAECAEAGAGPAP